MGNIQKQYGLCAENKISEYIITSLFAECPRPSRMATELADAI